MNKDIPTYQLTNLTHQVGDSGIFMLNQRIDRPGVAINIPYRRNFYAVGICLRGRAELNVNLEHYTITPDCLIAKPPHTINQWTAKYLDRIDHVIHYFCLMNPRFLTLTPDEERTLRGGHQHGPQV